MLLFNVLHLCMVLVVLILCLCCFMVRFQLESLIAFLLQRCFSLLDLRSGRRPDSSSTSVVDRCVTVVALLPSPI